MPDAPLTVVATSTTKPGKLTGLRDAQERLGADTIEGDSRLGAITSLRSRECGAGDD